MHLHTYCFATTKVMHMSNIRHLLAHCMSHKLNGTYDKCHSSSIQLHHSKMNMAFCVSTTFDTVRGMHFGPKGNTNELEKRNERNMRKFERKFIYKMVDTTRLLWVWSILILSAFGLHTHSITYADANARHRTHEQPAILRHLGPISRKRIKLNVPRRTR